MGDKYGSPADVDSRASLAVAKAVGRVVVMPRRRRERALIRSLLRGDRPEQA